MKSFIIYLLLSAAAFGQTFSKMKVQTTVPTDSMNAIITSGDAGTVKTRQVRADSLVKWVWPTFGGAGVSGTWLTGYTFSGGVTDHGLLTGLGDDDHAQYYKADGSRTLTGALVTTGKVIRPATDGNDAIKITKADGTTSFITFDTGNRWMIGQNWTLKASQLRFGTPTADGNGIMMSGGYQFIFSDALTAAGANASNIINNFNSYTGLLIKRTGSGTGDFISCQNSSGDNMWQLSYLGNISIIGTAAKSITVGRRTASGAGNNFTSQAGGAYEGGTNLEGGTAIVSGGISTGSAGSSVQIQTATPGASGTTDRTPSTKVTVDGNGLVTFAGSITFGGIQVAEIDSTADGRWYKITEAAGLIRFIPRYAAADTTGKW